MPHKLLADIGPDRIADMDASGVSLQICRWPDPGADLADAEQGPLLARAFNDRLHSAVREHPDRYAAFAHLPTTAPAAAADELERTVRDLGFKGALINGLTERQVSRRSGFRADPCPRGQALDVPIYIHPGLPPMEVRSAYYEGLPLATGSMLALAGWGWHAETAVHVLRLVLSGTLDRHPGLKLIIGHMGERLARDDGPLRSGVRPRDAELPVPYREPDHSRPGLDHHQRFLLAGAVHGGDDDVRRGSDPVFD